MPFSPRQALSTLWVCQVWAFFLFLPVCAEITTGHNRYVLFWSQWTPLIYLGCIVAVGLVLFFNGLLLRRFCPGSSNRIVGFSVLGSLIFLGGAILRDWFPVAHRMVASIPVLVILTALITVMLTQRQVGLDQIVAVLKKGAWIMSPLLPLFWINCFLYETYPVHTPKPLASVRSPVSADQVPSDNVYLFVFDGWSPKWTMTGGEVRKELTNLRQLSRQMFQFNNAHSPGCHTSLSLPRLLFQRKNLFTLHRGQPGFWEGDRFIPAQTLPSVFTEARSQGYRTYMLGWHHPYHVMLADHTDWTSSISWTQTLGQSPGQQALGFYWRWSRRFLGPILSEPLLCSKAYQDNIAMLAKTPELLSQTKAILSDPKPSGQFAVMHLTLPHFPYIYTAEGEPKSLRGNYHCRRSLLAQEHVEYLDRVIGELTDILKKQGKFDRSLIIFTSDHTQRWDPNLPQTAQAYTHVPLFIKFPNQQSGGIISEELSNVHLMAFLNQARSLSQPSGREVEQLLEKHDWTFDIADEEIRFRDLMEK